MRLRRVVLCVWLLCVISVSAFAASPTITSGPGYGTFSIGQIQVALTATGGNGTYAWAVISGSLPPGISIRTDIPSSFPMGAQAGLIGVATTPGSYSFTLQVTSMGTSVSQSATMKISALTSMDTGAPMGFVGTLYPGFTFTPLGNAAPVTWTVTGGSLPPPMSLSPAGALTGTPSTAGNYSWTVSLFDGTDTVFHTFSMSVFAINLAGPSGSSNPGFLPNATRFTAYSTSVTATGGAGGYTFTAGGGMPAGLNLSGAGAITGTPTGGPGKYTFTITAKDTLSVSFTRSMAIDVIDAPQPLPYISLNTAIYNLASIGTYYSRTIDANNGGVAPFTWSTIGPLPPGMGIRTAATSSRDFSPGEIELWGTPTATGSYNITLKVTDSLGATATQIFPFNVSSLAISGSDFLPNGTIGAAYSKTLRALGGTLPYTLAQLNSLNAPFPEGLSLNTGTFIVSGTPVENGSFQPIFQFTDNASISVQSADFFTVGDGTSTITVNQTYNLGTLTIGQSYSNQLTACCATGYSWSFVSGTMPTGLSIEPDGILSGTPTVLGTYTFLLKVADTTNSSNTGYRQFTLTVTPMSISTGGTLPFGDVTSFYSQTLVAIGGTGTLTWTLSPTSLPPPGLTLSGAGVLSGTPTQAGLFFFTITATDTASHIFTRTFSLSVYPAATNPPLDLVLGPNLGPFAVGGLTFQLAATGGTPPYTYSLTPSATPITGMRVVNAPLLPTNFSATTTGGYIGVMTTPGTYNTSIRVTDSLSHTFDRAITITISPLDFLIGNGNLPKADPGVAYSFTFPPTGGVGPYAWSATNLPPGITINSSTGEISGTSSDPGSYSPQITLTDSSPQSLTQGFTLVVNPFPITTSGVLPAGTLNTAYSKALLAPGCGTGCTWTRTGGSFPNGISISSGGVISGTPTTVQWNTFTIQVSGSNGTTQKVFSLQIANSTPQPLFITTTSPIVCCTAGQGAGNTVPVFAQGGTPPYTWSLQSGALPTGISIQGPGETLSSASDPGVTYLAGRMLVAGNYSFTLKVTDAMSNTATQAYTWSVAPIFFEYGTLPVTGNPLVYNTAYSQQLLMMGGSGSYTSWVPVTPMPPGLSLNASTGLVTGTPTNTGSFSPEIQVTDSAGNVGTTFVNFNVANSTGTLVNFGTGPNLGTYQQGFNRVFNLNLSGGTGPYAVTTLSALPAGFALESGNSLLSNAAGTNDLVGMPLAAGTSTFTLQATDSLGNIGVRTFSITVAPFSLFTSTTLPSASKGTPYSRTLDTWDNSGPVTWSLAAGSAYPPGLSVSAGGVVSGTPTQQGIYSFVLSATDASAAMINFTFNLVVSNITITSPQLLPTQATVGVFYSYTFTATGGASYTWSTSGTPPGGISLSPTGVLSGIPANATGLFSFPVTVTDGLFAATEQVTLYVNSTSPPLLSASISTALADAVAGQSYSAALNAFGGAPPYTWSLAMGSSLPPGLQFLTGALLPATQAPGSTLLAGAPTTPGSYSFDLIATDSHSAQTRRTYTLLVTSIVVLGGTLDNGTTGVPYAQQFTAVGGTGPYTFSAAPVNLVQDTLPPGLNISSTGLISGTPTSTGSYTFTLHVQDSAAHTFSRVYTLFVNNPAGFQITNTNPLTVRAGSAIGIFLFASGPGPYSWSLSSGLLPPGIGLTPDGILSGTITAPGNYQFTVRATNTGNSSITVDHVFTFRAGPMQIESTPYPRTDLPPAVVGTPYSFTFQMAGGTAPYTFTESEFSPVPGLNLSSAGVLSGTPTASGTYRVQPLVTENGGGQFNAFTYNLVVLPPATNNPLVSVKGANGGQPSVGAPFTLELYPVGGVPPYTYSISSGSLPSGISLLQGTNGVSAYFAGVPTTTSYSAFTLQVTDNVSQTAFLPIGDGNISPLAVSPGALSPGMVGSPYSVSLIPSGGTAPYTFQLSSPVSNGPSDMPVGMSLSSGGLLSGTPTYPGSYIIAYTLTDNASNSYSGSYLLTVDNAAGQVPTLTAPTAPITASYVQGSPAPGPIPISVNTSSHNLGFTDAILGIPGALVSAPGGTTNQVINLTLPSGLTTGVYEGLFGAAASGSVNRSAATPVILTVQIPTPGVVGLTQSAATTAITGAGLVVGTVTTATSATVPIGSVISQSPAATVPENPGTPVNLVISAVGQNRSFVSTTGSDANNCTATAYCRAFARALAVTNPGGEIVVVTSGGYGPATISIPVVITAIGIDASVTQTAAGQNGFTINTTGDVTLNGLNLNGGGTGNDGILVQAVGFLRLYNMQIQNFANNGIEFTASGNLAVYDSKVNDSGHDGLRLQNALANAYVHNTAFDNSAFAGADTVAGNMTIADSSAHYNQFGFYAEGGTVSLFGDRAIFNTTGMASSGTAKLYFADCLISDNTTAWNAGVGSTMAGSNPGTSLIAPGQATVGTLSAAVVLQVP